MSVTANIAVDVRGHLAGSNPLGAVDFEFAATRVTPIAPGTGAGQADRMFSDRRTLAASATEDLDLAGGLASPFGVAAQTMAKVKSILIMAAPGNTNDVVVGGAASNAFAAPFGAANNTVKVPPGGMLLLTAPAAGWTVTAGTGDLLKIANGSSGSSVTYDILILGTSA